MNKFQKICSCIKCRRVTTTSQLSKNHADVCPIPRSEVKFPGNVGRTAWNKGKTKDTDERVKKGAKTLLSSIDSNHGKCSDHLLEVERRKKISAHAKLHHGGYRENAGRSKKFTVYDSYGNRTTLQSTYEHDVFEILCELGINWHRAKALKYDGRNYFADFYLPDYDVWLDPKNSYKSKCDAEKIQAVINQNQVKLFVLLKNQITKEYINRIMVS